MKPNKYPEPFVGQKIGEWIIISSEKITKDRAGYVLCKCSCGKEKLINYHCMMRGDSNSCGCIRGSKRFEPLKQWILKNGPPAKKPPGVAAFNELYNQYRHSAKSKDIEFTINKDEFRKITSMNCHYCDNPPNMVRKYRGYGKYLHNGIDRKNNDIGYILENCLPCCAMCNYLKRDHQYILFVNHIHKMSENLKNEKNP